MDGEDGRQNHQPATATFILESGQKEEVIKRGPVDIGQVEYRQ